MTAQRTYTITMQVTTSDPVRARNIRTVFLTSGSEIPPPDGVKVTQDVSDGITTQLLMERVIEP
jgi:hypothetical protein